MTVFVFPWRGYLFFQRCVKHVQGYSACFWGFSHYDVLASSILYLGWQAHVWVAHTFILQCLTFPTTLKSFHGRAAVVRVTLSVQLFKIKERNAECTQGLHFCFMSSLIQSAPPWRPSQSLIFIQLDWKLRFSLFFFFTTDVHIVYDYLYRRFKAFFFFYLHKGNTFKIHLLFFFFFFFLNKRLSI